MTFLPFLQKKIKKKTDRLTSCCHYQICADIRENYFCLLERDRGWRPEKSRGKNRLPKYKYFNNAPFFNTLHKKYKAEVKSCFV